MRWISCIVFTLITVSSFGQGAVNSPFSRFGLGDLISEAPMHIRQMGGISTAFLDTRSLNFDNPASLSFLDATAFDLGLDFQRSKLSDNVNSSTQWSGNLGYMALGFTLRNPRNRIFTNEEYKFNWGMGFALMNNSTVSYDITRLDSLQPGNTFLRSFEGNGGTYKAMWSNAVKYGDFSLGVSIGYLFGKIDYSRNVDFIDELAAYDNNFSNSYSLRGFYNKIGLTYFKVLNKKAMEEDATITAPNSISIGLSFKPNTSFSTNSEISEINTALSGGFELVDTLFVGANVDGAGTYPGELAFGATYTHGLKYGVGVDFRQTFWENYRNEANPEELTNTTRLGFGGFFRPDPTSINSIFARSAYRLGFYFEQDPRTINNETIHTFGVTIGAGLPLLWQRRSSQFNLGLDFGRRSIADTLTENYVKITFGFTFNESDWFIKRKFN